MEKQTEGTPRAFRPSVSMRIFGDGLEFDEITRTFGLTPTRTLRKGEILEDIGHAADHDVWSYCPVNDDGTTMDECLTRLCVSLRPHVSYLRYLQERYRVIVECSCYSRKVGDYPVNTGGIRLGHECLRLFVELKIPLHVGLTHFHDSAQQDDGPNEDSAIAPSS